MKTLTFNQVELIEGAWTPGETITVDISTGVQIFPHDAGSEIKVWKMDPEKGIVGEDVYHSVETPVILKDQL